MVRQKWLIGIAVVVFVVILETIPQTTRIVARRGKTLVFLEPNEVWAFEALDRLTRVHTPHGTFDVDLTLSVIESSMGRTLMRVHRNWLVNAACIKDARPRRTRHEDLRGR